MRLLILLCCISLPAAAQIPNPGFESRLPDSTPAHWRPNTFVVVPTDTTCSHLGWDSIRISTHDAHSGSFAYEIRVATACDQTYSGNIQANRSQADTGFFDQRIPISGQPAAFSFYYKFNSVGGDVAIAEAAIEGEFGDEIGEGLVKLPAASTWTKATLAMTYVTTDTGGLLRLDFRIGNDTAVHFGSRFTIDDISLVAATGVPTIRSADQTLRCYPSPAADFVRVQVPDGITSGPASLKVIDMTGKTVWEDRAPLTGNCTLSVDTRSLAPGVYQMVLNNRGQLRSGRFSKLAGF